MTVSVKTLADGTAATIQLNGTDVLTIKPGAVAAPTFEGSATKWGGAAKTVSTAAPSGGADGDIWFQYE